MLYFVAGDQVRPARADSQAMFVKLQERLRQLRRAQVKIWLTQRLMRHRGYRVQRTDSLPEPV